MAKLIIEAGTTTITVEGDFRVEPDGTDSAELEANRRTFNQLFSKATTLRITAYAGHPVTTVRSVVAKNPLAE